jgi:cysteinyl-tRNA synthetase
MALSFFNTLKRKKELFKPVQVGKVSLYTCGPTVYNYAHIGNYRAYLFEDLLRRYLKYKGFSVKQVMNITDIDDKTIHNAHKEGTSLKKFTEKYTKSFLEDLNTLNVEPAEEYPKATEHVQEMILIIQELLDKGLAYVADDKSVYFSIKKFKQYGKLAHINVDELQEGKRVKHDEYEKETAADFALWKAEDKDDHGVSWKSPFGKGRPGWHIECSAMSMKHLSKSFTGKKFSPGKFATFDIHTGGVDNIFPHHEDEIAQSEGATGKKFVNYWLHCEHLLVDGKKMSKSLGNFYTLRDLLEKECSPVALRWILLTSHYKMPLNFTLKGVGAAQATVDRIFEFVNKLEAYKGNGKLSIEKLLAQTEKAFEKAMDDDLNMPSALSGVFDMIKEVNGLMGEGGLSSKDKKGVLVFMKKLDGVLGILDMRYHEKVSKDVLNLAEQREQARKEKNWKTADKLRDKIKEKGYEVVDGKEGYRVKKL